MNTVSLAILIVLIILIILDVRYICKNGAGCSGDCGTCGKTCHWAKDIRRASRHIRVEKKLHSFFKKEKV
jgi:hypothetical protein